MARTDGGSDWSGYDPMCGVGRRARGIRMSRNCLRTPCWDAPRATTDAAAEESGACAQVEQIPDGPIDVPLRPGVVHRGKPEPWRVATIVRDADQPQTGACSSHVARDEVLSCSRLACSRFWVLTLCGRVRVETQQAGKTSWNNCTSVSKNEMRERKTLSDESRLRNSKRCGQRRPVALARSTPACTLRHAIFMFGP